MSPLPDPFPLEVLGGWAKPHRIPQSRRPMPEHRIPVSRCPVRGRAVVEKELRAAVSKYFQFMKEETEAGSMRAEVAVRAVNRRERRHGRWRMGFGKERKDLYWIVQ